MSLLHQGQPSALAELAGLPVLSLDTSSILWVYMPFSIDMVFIVLIALNGLELITRRDRLWKGLLGLLYQSRML